jgi:hypothetical protein
MKRDSSWTYVLYLGRDASGKKQQKWVGGHRTKREAEDALTEALERMRTGVWVDPGTTTLGEFLTEWLAAMESNVLDTTYRGQRFATDASTPPAWISGSCFGSPTRTTFVRPVAASRTSGARVRVPTMPASSTTSTVRSSSRCSRGWRSTLSLAIVVGVMNEFAFLGEHFFEGDLTALSLRMAGTPVGPLRSTHRFPERALAALLADRASGSGVADHTATIIQFPGSEMADPDRLGELER